jgi:histidinol-phosphate/aromatic aminotransferase/cobyric acid decarboxylase-like protein
MTVAVDNALELFRSASAHSPSRFTPDSPTPVDFCIPCNPYFPTPGMFDQLGSRMRDILTCQPNSTDVITERLCATLGLNPRTVTMGNGSTELITWIDHLLVRESLATPIPTFGQWTDQPMKTGKRVDMFQLPEQTGFALDHSVFIYFVRARGSRVAVICNPNNPDGGYLSRQSVVTILDALIDIDLIVIDESFLDFADAENWPSVANEAVVRPNVIVLRSLGKTFGLHGVRLGYLIANPFLAAQIRSALPKWNLSSLAETVVFMLSEYQREYSESIRRLNWDRQEMYRQLKTLPGLTVYPSQGNFLFARLPDGADGKLLRDQLLANHGIVIRECGNKLGSSSQFIRLTVRPQEDVHRLLSGMYQSLYGGDWYASAPAANAIAPAPTPYPAPAQIPQAQIPQAQIPAAPAPEYTPPFQMPAPQAVDAGYAPSPFPAPNPTQYESPQTPQTYQAPLYQAPQNNYQAAQTYQRPRPQTYQAPQSQAAEPQVFQAESRVFQPTQVFQAPVNNAQTELTPLVTPTSPEFPSTPSAPGALTLKPLPPPSEWNGLGGGTRTDSGT